ncbi:MAG: TetR/AcrR family transcriptional regulator [Bacteroidia bacterium]
MIHIRINEQIFLKDPESSDLGQRIVRESILMIDQMGFEQFTFKKLAQRIDSTEASVYRYFESKHKLLIYLVSWYWNWLEYQLMFFTNNIPSPVDRLRIALEVISKPHRIGGADLQANTEALHHIVISESPKAYLSKEVDNNNKEGYFLSYKRLCRQIADIAREINPQYPYPTALISTVMESAHHQAFFSQHLPRLTDIHDGDDDGLAQFLFDLTMRVLRCPAD